MGTHAQALLAALDTACMNVDELGQASAALFQTHADHAVITSSRGWPTPPAPACSRRSAMTAPGSPMREP
jgi:hypothetical protein